VRSHAERGNEKIWVQLISLQPHAALANAHLIG
jgi:hypothetical protein